MPPVESIIAGFLVLTILASIISRRIRVPYTQFLVIIGIILASLSASSAFGIGYIFSSLTGGDYFVALILPPLLFDATINVGSTELKSVIRPALVLATLGVVIATLVGGLLLTIIAGIPLGVAFLFAAVISPTDTATVLEVFRRIRVPARLSTLLETEAAFNDATGILVFSVILASITVATPSLLGVSTNFALLLGGGVLVGLAVGFGTELLSSFVDDSLSETILTVISVYGSYSLASSLGVSGLIAVAAAGLYYGNLTMRTTLAPRSRVSVKSFWQMMAFVANSVAFLFIGLSTDVLQILDGFLVIMVAFLAVSIARAASVYSILGLFAVAGEKIPRSWRNISMLGGMRGALSIVLLASIPSAVPYRGLVATMVLGVTFISITLQGPTLTLYAGRIFPARRKPARKEANARLSAAVAEMQRLRDMRERGEVSEEEFAAQLGVKEKEIEEIEEEVRRSNQTKRVLHLRSQSIRSLFRRPRRDGRKKGRQQQQQSSG